MKVSVMGNGIQRIGGMRFFFLLWKKKQIKEGGPMSLVKPREEKEKKNYDKGS